MTPDQPSTAEPEQIQLATGRASYIDEGRGTPVVAIHGLPGSVRDYRWLAPALSESVRLIRLDMPSFGDSYPNTCGSLVEDQVDFVLSVLDQLGIDAAVFIGHSFGSPVALRLGADHPQRTLGVALLGPVGLRPHRGLRAFPPIKPLYMATRIPLAGSLFLKRIRQAFEQSGFKNVTNPQIARTMAILRHFSFDAHGLAAQRLSRPSWVAWCDDDELIEPKVINELMALLTDVTRVHFETGGHNLQKSRAVEVGRALATWIADLPHRPDPV